MVKWKLLLSVFLIVSNQTSIFSRVLFNCPIGDETALSSFCQFTTVDKPPAALLTRNFDPCLITDLCLWNVRTYVPFLDDYSGGDCTKVLVCNRKRLRPIDYVIGNLYLHHRFPVAVPWCPSPLYMGAVTLYRCNPPRYFRPVPILDSHRSRLLHN